MKLKKLSCVGQFFSGSFEQRAGKVQVVKKRKGGNVLRDLHSAVRDKKRGEIAKS
jgi:hypothetical protein